MEEDDFLLLLYLTNSSKHNTKTQQQISDYIFKETGRRYSQQVISYNIKKYSELTRKRATKRYSEQDLEEVMRFINKNHWLYSLPNCLAVDEFNTYIGEAPRYAWSRRGCPVPVSRRGRGSAYTLILCVINAKEKAVVSYKLIKNERSKKRKTKGTSAVDFYEFIRNIEFPPSDKPYYLLLDNVSIHNAPHKLKEAGLMSMEELARQKNIILIYLPKYSPEINPAELCFNTTRHFMEQAQSNTERELEEAVIKIIDMINQKDLTKYFKHCQEFFSFDKSGN